MNKICTSLEQSKKLVELGIDRKSSDMYYWCGEDLRIGGYKAQDEDYDVSAWSLAALLKYLGKIKPQVYTPILFLSEGKWTSQFVEYGHGNVCEVSCNNPIDACVDTIIKLHERNLL